MVPQQVSFVERSSLSQRVFYRRFSTVYLPIPLYIQLLIPPQTMGVISLALGLWIYLTMNEYATFSEGKDLLGSAFLVAVGFGIIIVGFLGVMAALWESVIMTSVVSEYI